MTQEVKLFTEKEARIFLGMVPAKALAELRERGLIAEEPVDPLQEAVEAIWHLAIGPKHEAVPKMTAELRRRGMELAPRKELTREMVGKIYNATKLFSPTYEAHITRLHAALTEALQ